MKRLLLTVCLFLSAPLIARTQPTYVLLDDDSLILGEVIERQDGLFLRDASDGVLLRPEQIRSVYSDPYRRAILSSSPSKAAVESLFYFNASSRYVWNPESRFSFFKNDTAVKIAKITMLALTGLAYFETRRANERLAKNANVLRSDALQGNFATARDHYYGIGGATILFFAFETGFAYRNFGRHVDGTDLGITTAQEPISVREYINRKPAQLPQAELQAFLQIPVF